MSLATVRSRTCIEIAMRLTCPYCGERDRHEFTYRGDAAPQRPALRQARAGEPALPSATEMFDYVYIRENVPGRMRELWHHSGGCRTWLVVERDVTTHAVGRIVPARDAKVSAP